MSLKFISFDLDGTLLDVKAAQNAGGMFIYENFGFSGLTDACSFLRKWDELTEGYYDAYLRRELTYEEQRIKRVTGLFDHYGKELKADSAPDVYSAYLTAFESSWRPFDDVIPCLDILSERYSLGILTNGDTAQQTQKLERTGLITYFDSVIACGDLVRPKPAPEPFLFSCRQAGVQKEEYCHVGDDMYSDIIPCLGLSIPCFYLNRKNEIVADEQVRSVRDLLELAELLS
jgi:putative hydrolase of the HAD superfamily